MARIVYVDASVTGGLQNGTSWANAYSSYQVALTAAAQFDSLWVAAGTYYPGASGDNAATFYAAFRAKSFGGFTGFNGLQETSLSQRNWVTNVTILSGDLDQSGTLSAADAYHVVTSVGGLDTTSVFDGFRITGGNAIGGGSNDRGGGVYYFGSAIRLINCDIRNNRSQNFGGGIFGNGQLSMDRCFVRNNSSNEGGGMYTAGFASQIRIFNTSISNNSATSFGGAINTGVSNFRLYNCTLAGNTSNVQGSVIASGSSAIIFHNCIIWGNSNPNTQFVFTVPTVTRSIVQNGLASGTFIINADPQFRDSDYRIKSCSPAVDAGDSLALIVTDNDGFPRGFDGDNNGVGKWDLGAFEQQVNNVPPASNPIVGPSVVCINAPNVAYQPATIPGGNSYAWSLAGGGTIDGSASSPNLLIDWGGTVGNYVLTMVETGDLSGCSTTNTLTVSLQTAPTVTLSPNGAGAICAGDSILLTGSGSGVTRQWYRNGGVIPGATNATFQAQLAGRYNMLLTGSNGCADSAALAYTLSINPKPVFSLTHSLPAQFCAGGTFPLSGPVSGNAYQWYRNGVAIPGAVSTTYNAITAGYYNLLFTDANGCRDSATAGVNVVQNARPVVSISPAGTDTICPSASLLLTGSASGQAAWQWYLNGASIGGATASTFSATLTGQYNVVITDGNGCQDSAFVGKSLRVGDFQNPVALCRNATLYLNGSGSATLAPSQIDNGSTDNCAISNRSASTTTFTCAQLGSNSVTLTVTDPGGNTATCVGTVTVLDTIRPIASCATRTVYLGTNGQVTLAFAQVNNASSDNCGITATTISPNTFICADSGLHSVNVVLSDASGNTRACTASITIADSTRPTAICANPTIILNGGGTASITLGQVDNGSSDNCGVASRSLSRSAFTCADVPGVAVTLSVRDVSGNVGTCQSYVRVQDLTPPIAVCRDTTIYIDNSGQSLLSPANVDGGSSDNCAIAMASITQSLFTCLDTGLNAVTLRVEDADTNFATCIANVTVRDTVRPVAVCTPATFYLNASGIAVVNPLVFGANSTDNCTSFDTAYVNVGPYTCAGIGAHTITLTVEDYGGFSSSCTGTISIADTMAPAATCQNISVVLNGAGNASITAAMIDNGTVDNCQLDTIFLDRYSFTCADVGNQSVVLTARDSYNNTRSCAAVVMVIDQVAPVANCQNRTLYLNAGGIALTSASAVNNGSSDNCGIASMTLSKTLYNCSNLGSNNATLTVNDAGGNSAQCVAVITVLDTLRPNAVCSNASLYLDGNGVAALSAAAVSSSSTDNCGIATRSVSISSFSCADTASVHAVLVTVTDASGNFRTCTSNVTVADTTRPVIGCTAPTLYLDASGSLFLTTSVLAGSTADNCGIASSNLAPSNLSCSDLGSKVLTATFRDYSANLNSCTVTATVLDTIRPVVTCLNPTVYLDAAGNATLVIADLEGSTTDACGIASQALSRTTLTCADLGTLAVILTAADSSSNIGSCTGQVTVLDTIAPSIVCTPQSISLGANGTATMTASLLSSGSTDACGISTRSASQTSFSCGDQGVNNVTVTVTDASGNSSSCQTQVTVTDLLAPSAVCNAIVVQLDATGHASISPNDVGSGSLDNCAIVSMVLDRSTFNCSDIGTLNVILNVSDNSGSGDSCLAQVQVVDTLGLTAVGADLGPDTTVCNGLSVTLSTGINGASYLWSTGATTPTITVSTSGPYAVVVTDSIGCTGRDTLQLFSTVTPDPNLRTESQQAVICQNDSLVLLVDSVYAGYAWSTGATTPTTTVTTGGNYIVQVTDSLGCSLIRSLAVQFVPFPAPVAAIMPASPVSLCEGVVATLDAGAGYFGYQWSTGQTTQTIQTSTPGGYSVQVWNGFGCHSTSPVTQVVAQSSPVPTITVTGNTLTCDQTAASYQWYLGTIALPGAINQSYSPSIAGNFLVRVVYANGCVNTSAPLPFVVGIGDVDSALQGLQVYPNPTEGRITLTADRAIRQGVDLRVIDLYGKVLLTERLSSLETHALDLGEFAAGMYLLEVRRGNRVARIPVIRH
jgi:hypothetical protein